VIQEPGATPTRIELLECNLDDMTGEALGYALEQILDAGALDAWFTPIMMKKSRPAVLLSVLCRLEDADRLIALLLHETSTLGVRRRVVERVIASRQTLQVETPWGPVSCKVKRIDGVTISIKPEHDDCARIAREQGLPLEQVVNQARSLAQDAAQD
jgi:pyridinium-3,5-bisthiocarboxylic acid mononucleotide nickel chelatase